MNREANALLLDFDGTLADSIGLMRLAYGAFLSHFGVLPREEEFGELNGPPLREVVNQLVTRYQIPLSGDNAHDFYTKKIEAAFLDVMPVHGAVRLMKIVRGWEWKIAIVTSNDRHRVWSWLKRRQLSHMVDAVIGGDIRPGKPSAVPYLTAISELSCIPENAWAVEDSDLGYQSARSSGAKAFFFRPLNRSRSSLEISTVESLSALPPLLQGKDREISTRLATADDRSFLFSLRNDTEAVMNFRTARQLSIEELEERFSEDISFQRKVICISEFQGSKAAMIRFDKSSQAYTISIILDRAYRGRGLAKACLQSAIDAFLSFRNLATLEAEVAGWNVPSIRLFESCGFVRHEMRGQFLKFQYCPAPG